jgi:phosphoenolpyruvate synthase/pyruvate phosphate dikinase
MQRFCDKNSDGLKDWIKKIKKIQNFGKNSKILGEKVIFIDMTVQFLRATYLGDKITRHIKEKKVIYKQKQFKGLVAWAGFKQISGVVKVVLAETDFLKFKKGEILVTDETSVNFLPLMQKAVAIITDNGGILCHAAIVSREMKKPCIIGTKIATRVLKDGDLVEIDANEGVVKILKRV